MDPIGSLGAQASDDLRSRGFSRRDMARIGAVFGIGLVSARAGTPAWADPAPAPAQAMPAKPDVRIGSNECWAGPFAPGQEAAARIIGVGNRYAPGSERDDFIAAVSAIEAVPADHVAPWPGSSDPLARTVVTFCSPTRGLVTANPTFELAWETAAWLGAPIKKVPLAPDMAHDVKAMLAADPNAGLYYICTPNNPTGGITALADIEWLVANKPAGAVVLVDEAYTHFAGVPTASYLAAAGKDVVVLRTFSKVFGMAGMRMGYVMTRPDLLARMMRYDGGMLSGALPLPSLACATASVTQAGLIVARRQEMQAARAMTLAHLTRRKLAVIPGSAANMFMIDWKTVSGPAMVAAYGKRGVEIGRSWDIWPTASRVTVGSMAEMEKFCAVTDQVLA